MAQIDDIVGSVMKYLKDNGLEGDTIIGFTTDNGAENFTWPDGGQTPFAGGKGTALEGGFRVPMILRWPGKVPAGKVENGIMSGLDWFPTLVAAAGNPNITDELLKGKQLGDRTYKVHLDGYNQMDLITGKGPSARHEIFYFTEGTLSAVRIDDFKYRFTDQPQRLAGRHDQGRLADPDQSPLRPVRAHRHAERREWVARVLQLVPVRVLALPVRAERGCEGRADRDRVPADAAGGELQPRGRQGADREGPGRARPVSVARKSWSRRAVRLPGGQRGLFLGTTGTPAISSSVTATSDAPARWSQRSGLFARPAIRSIVRRGLAARSREFACRSSGRGSRGSKNP